MPRIPLQPETRAVRTLSVVVTALMVALAIAALAGAAALRHVDLDWRAALANRWTVELTAPPIITDQTAADAQASDGSHAVAVLRTIPGIIDAEMVGPDEVRRLLQPWLDDAAAIKELPLPTLIDLRLDPATPPQFAATAQKISSLIPGATLDDHGAWTRDLGGLAQTGEILGVSMFAVIAVAATLTVAAAARARLAINRAEIHLLHRIGASDFYIIRQFQADALRSAILGAILGAALLGAAGFALVRRGAEFAPLLPRLRLDTLDWIVLAAAPLGAILVAVLVAQLTARAMVRRLP